MRRYPALIVVNTPTGDHLRIAMNITNSWTVAKTATNCHHAWDTLQQRPALSI